MCTLTSLPPGTGPLGEADDGGEEEQEEEEQRGGRQAPVQRQSGRLPAAVCPRGQLVEVAAAEQRHALGRLAGGQLG